MSIGNREISFCGQRRELPGPKAARLLGSGSGLRVLRRSGESISNPCGIPATIQNGKDPNDVFLEAIINREGESFAQQAVISEMEGVNPSIEIERLYV